MCSKNGVHILCDILYILTLVDFVDASERDPGHFLQRHHVESRHEGLLTARLDRGGQPMGTRRVVAKRDKNVRTVALKPKEKRGKHFLY